MPPPSSYEGKVERPNIVNNQSEAQALSCASHGLCVHLGKPRPVRFPLKKLSGEKAVHLTVTRRYPMSAPSPLIHENDPLKIFPRLGTYRRTGKIPEGESGMMQPLDLRQFLKREKPNSGKPATTEVQ